MESLATEVGIAERLMISTYERHIHEPGFFMSRETEAQQDLIREHLQRAMRCLDLSEVPPANREKTAMETVMLLSEILDRVGSPPPESIPAAAQIKEASWTVPNTEIRITKVAAGPRAGEYLFSPDSVTRSYDFYQKVRHIHPSDNFDFYAFYALSPGDLVPPKWYAYIQKLPSWFHTVIIDSARWQWIALGVTLFLALGFCFAIYRMSRAGGALAEWLPSWGASLALPVSILITIWFAGAFVEELNFTGPVQRMLATGFDVVLYLPLTWLAVVVSNCLADWIVRAWDLQGYDFDAGIMRVAIRLLGLLTATGILAYGASQIGIPLVGILAGLGVGGLAVALAAQPTIENFIGGIMIYADRPVRVGDRCSFGDVSGTVEEIGIRSTRIRADDRSVTSIPNSDFAKARIVNLSSRDRVLFNTTVGLPYGTTEQQVRNILHKMRDLLASFAPVKDASSSVHFAGFGADSLRIDIAAELSSSGHDDLAGAREELLLKLFNIVEEAGTQLAKHA